jgi:hypothetical protein
MKQPARKPGVGCESLWLVQAAHAQHYTYRASRNVRACPEIRGSVQDDFRGATIKSIVKGNGYRRWSRKLQWF